MPVGLLSPGKGSGSLRLRGRFGTTKEYGPGAEAAAGTPTGGRGLDIPVPVGLLALVSLIKGRGW